MNYPYVATIFLSILSFALLLFNPILGFHTGFGMTIDLSAMPIFLILFLFGKRYAMLSLTLLFTFILLFSPTSYIGAITKTAATLPGIILLPDINLFLIALSILSTILLYALPVYFGFTGIYAGLLPFIVLLLIAYFIRDMKIEAKDLTIKKLIFISLIIIFVRGILMIITNFYFAGPIFFKLSPQEFIHYLESSKLPFLGGSTWYFIIFFWNAIQAIVEIYSAYILYEGVKHAY